MTGVQSEVKELKVAPVTVRAAATWFIEQPTLPRHGTVKAFEEDFRQTLEHLLPRVEQLAEGLAPGDVHAHVAMATVAEARKRLDEPEAAGLHGEVKRVKRIAWSVIDLCDHFDILSGLRDCRLCEKPIQDRDAWEFYDQPSRDGSAPAPSRIHAACACRVRPV